MESHKLNKESVLGFDCYPKRDRTVEARDFKNLTKNHLLETFLEVVQHRKDWSLVFQFKFMVVLYWET